MPTALITGASAGIGLELAKLFAADKHDLILVARRRERLEVLGAELAAVHGITAQVLPADLGSPGGWQAVANEVTLRRWTVDCLVNNAGFGTHGAFLEQDPARQIEMLQVNVASVVGLTRALVPAMVARGHGRVLTIGSIAGFQPGPWMATYCASKAFVNSFSEALSVELAGTGVTATVACPGPVASEFGALAGNDTSRAFAMGVATSEDTARAAYRALQAGRAMAVPGATNVLAVQAQRFLPRAFVRFMAGRLNAAVPDDKRTPSR